MVCSKCQKTLKKTELATPGVKRKNEIYLGSPTAEKSKAARYGISKNKLLSKAAKNPYSAYSSSCETCKTKTERGRTFCQRCAYKKNACAMCGKGVTSVDGTKNEPVVQGQRFSAK